MISFTYISYNELYNNNIIYNAAGTWEKTEYVKKQGWATMPGEKEADSKVADECVKLLMLIS